MRKKAKELKNHLRPGNVYRRSTLTQWSKDVDRHLGILQEDGMLQKVGSWLYFYPKKTVFGFVPPSENVLISSFLNDDNFLMSSPSFYTSLGLGLTQLYNDVTVYNKKRHGKFRLGNRDFNFKLSFRFPKKLSEEFLIIELVNDLEKLGLERKVILEKITSKVKNMNNKVKLLKMVQLVGKIRTKRFFEPLLEDSDGR